MLLKIKNWEHYQHYKDRNPPWIKLHFALLSSHDWVMLDDASRVLALASMLLASRSEGEIDATESGRAYLKRVAYLNTEPDFKPLVDCGFMVDASAPQADASKVLALARPETEERQRRGEQKRATEVRTSPHQIGEGPAHDMATLLAALILENDKSARMPATTEPWAVAIQRMQISDTRDWGEIEQVIRYSQRSDHWRSCVLDAVGLVKHYRRIRLQVDRGNGKDEAEGTPKVDRFVYAELENQYNDGGADGAGAWIGQQRDEFRNDLSARLTKLIGAN